MSDVVKAAVAPPPAVVSFVCMSVIVCICTGVPTVMAGTGDLVLCELIGPNQHPKPEDI